MSYEVADAAKEKKEWQSGRILKSQLISDAGTFYGDVLKIVAEDEATVLGVYRSDPEVNAEIFDSYLAYVRNLVKHNEIDSIWVGSGSTRLWFSTNEVHVAIDDFVLKAIFRTFGDGPLKKDPSWLEKLTNYKTSEEINLRKIEVLKFLKALDWDQRQARRLAATFSILGKYIHKKSYVTKARPYKDIPKEVAAEIARMRMEGFFEAK